MAHRLHTCWTTMWSNACAKNLELVEYDHAAAALTKYCNQASGVQEQLPESIKKGSSTRFLIFLFVYLAYLIILHITSHHPYLGGGKVLLTVHVPLMRATIAFCEYLPSRTEID